METTEFQQIESKGESDYTVDYYPFEIMETTFVGKKCRKYKGGQCKKCFPFRQSPQIRCPGLLQIPIQLEWDGGYDVDYINIWISTSSTTSEDEEEDKKEGNYFVIGEKSVHTQGSLSQCH